MITFILFFSIYFLCSSFVSANECYIQKFNLQGKDNGNHCAFLSIPYATAKRFQAPIDLHDMPHDSTLDTFHGFCPQTCVLPDGLCNEIMTEDCLRLNIYVPKNSSLFQKNKHDTYKSASLPVMAFLPGGGFEMGGAECLAYEGTELTKRGIILVTINYRVGSFGFLVHKDFKIQGNMGLKDQISALKWIQKNIANFDGDASKVTLGGESAGAQSIAVHLVSPKTKGLFRNAILESTTFSIWMRSIDSAHKLGQTLADFTNCKNLQCLQDIPMDQMIIAQEKSIDKFSPEKLIHLSTLFLPFTPTVDNDLLTDQPLTLIQQGKYNQEIPILMGNNEEEGRMFIFLGFKEEIGSWTYRAIIAALFKFQALTVLDKYPVSKSPSNDFRVLTSMVATDYIFTAPIHNASLTISSPRNPVYQYEFMHPLKSGWGNRYSFCEGHSCHGAELAFVFAPAASKANFSPEEQALSNQIISYWTNFVKTGNPNGSNLSSWSPAHENSSCMIFKDGTSELKSQWKVDLLQFWNKIGYEKLD